MGIHTSFLAIDRLSDSDQKDLACVSVRDICEIPQISQDPVVQSVGEPTSGSHLRLECIMQL